MYDDNDVEMPLLFRALVPVLAVAWTIAATWYVIVTITPSNWILLFIGWSIAESVVIAVVGVVVTGLSMLWFKITGRGWTGSW